jgi:hypothetical protein
MKYSIDYQYMSKGASRPHDDGEIVGIQANDESGLVILPNVGDYVGISNSGNGRTSFHGKVRSRLFRYICGSDSDSEYCVVTIVVEQTDDDWSKLVKE